MSPARPRFFAAPLELRAWLDEHHATLDELLVGFFKKGSKIPGITWPESVDEALCFGWIDGVRKRVDDERYTIRFTPRRQGSIWSALNVRRVGELQAEGRMREAGLRAFAARSEARSAVYSYEQGAVALHPGQQAALEASPEAWAYFQAQAPWYRKAAIHWVTSAKGEATKARRLATLVEDSAAGRHLKHLARRPGSKGAGG